MLEGKTCREGPLARKKRNRQRSWKGVSEAGERGGKKTYCAVSAGGKRRG